MVAAWWKIRPVELFPGVRIRDGNFYHFCIALAADTNWLVCFDPDAKVGSVKRQDNPNK
jgi:hypothetical protein